MFPPTVVGSRALPKLYSPEPRLSLSCMFSVKVFQNFTFQLWAFFQSFFSRIFPLLIQLARRVQLGCRALSGPVFFLLVVCAMPTEARLRHWTERQHNHCATCYAVRNVSSFFISHPDRPCRKVLAEKWKIVLTISLNFFWSREKKWMKKFGCMGLK